MLMRLVVAVLLALCSSLVHAPPAGAMPAVTYSLAYLAQSRVLAVRVCVRDASSSRRFFSTEENAERYLDEVVRESGAPVTRDDGMLVASAWKAGECLRYTVALERVAQARRSEFGWQAGADMLVSARAVLWRVRGLATEADTEVDVDLPHGYALSVPWTPLDRAPHRRFRLGTTSPSWPTLIGIGRFAEREIAADAGGVRLAITGVPDKHRAAVLDDYVATTVADSATVFPRLFARAPQVVLIAVGAQRDAVPFGQSFRGGGTAIVLFVDPSRPGADYLDAWTLHHEFVHLAHPYLGLEGRWISEGIATYFQNVVRARARRQTPRHSWEEIEAGFGRGRNDHSGESLEDTSVEMSEGRHYMRAYWSGTALMLLADTELRQRAQPMSVEIAINRYLACCADQRRPDVREFLALLDRQVGGETFTRLYRQHARSDDFPDVSRAYDALGIAVSGKTLHFSDDADAVAMRRAIMGGD